MKKLLLICFLLIPVSAFAGMQCAPIFDRGEEIAIEVFETTILRPEHRKEWAEAREFFTAENVQYRIEQFNQAIYINFLTTGNHPINRIAKRLYEKHNATFIYQPGTEGASFGPYTARNNDILNLYISLSLSFLKDTKSLTRNEGLLHETKHLFNFIAAYAGVESPFYGIINVSVDASIPSGNKHLSSFLSESSQKPSGLLNSVVSWFKAEKPQTRRERLAEVYKNLSVDELSTYFKGAYHEALKLSRMLKMKNSESEIATTRYELLKHLETLHVMSELISFNLRAAIPFAKGSIIASSVSAMGKSEANYVLFEFSNQNISLMYEAYLPMTANYKNTTDTQRRVLDQLEWSIHMADRVHTMTSELQQKHASNMELQSFVNEVLRVINPQVLKSLETPIK